MTNETRTEMLVALRNDPTLMQLADPEITVTAPTAERTAKETPWRSDPAAVDWKAGLREGLPSGTLDLLERMSADGLFDHDALEMFWHFGAGKVLYAPRCKPETSAVIRPAFPDCAFDRAFGYACTEAQKTRIEASRKKKSKLTLY